MFKRLNMNPYSLIKTSAFGFIGVFAYKFIHKYIESEMFRWVACGAFLMFGISTPIAIKIADALIPEDF